MNHSDELRELLNDGMNQQRKIAAELYKFLDKALVYLSAGGIVLSVTFVKDIIGGECIKNVILLEATWGLWTATVFCVLFSYRLAQSENYRALSSIHNSQSELTSGTTDPVTISNRLNKKMKELHSKWGKWISIFNWAGFVSYFLGIVSMTWFACTNN